jgi:hypothetical protein
VTFVSTEQTFGAGPLQALRVAPDGHGSTLQTLTAPGERTRDAALAADSGAAYAAWASAGRVRHSIRVVRVAGPIVGAVRTLSGSENVVSQPPAFAMTPRGRALLAYMVRAGGIRLVSRRAG